MYCIRCGSKIEESAGVCGVCGNEAISNEKVKEITTIETEKNIEVKTEEKSNDETEIVNEEMQEKEELTEMQVVIQTLTQIKNGIYVCAVGIFVSVITAIIIYNHYLNGWGFR